MFEGITPLHLVALLVIVLIILGPGKLPEVGAALGKGIREFRRAAGDIREATSLEPAAKPTIAAPTLVAPTSATGDEPKDIQPKASEDPPTE